MLVTTSGLTDVGMCRDHNEDVFLINHQLNLFLVADGMGGHNAGEHASALCVSTIERVINDVQVSAYGRRASISNPVDRSCENLSYATRFAGRVIYQKASQHEHLHGMGTTVVGLYLSHAHAIIAHVGDSRAYAITESGIRQLTEDHSFVARQIKAGFLTKEQAKTHRMRNIIYRSLGFQPDVEVEVSAHPVHSGDIFVLCSDGLSGHLEDHEIGQLAIDNEPFQATRCMVELACDRGGEDNITVLVVRIDGCQ